MAKWPYSLAAWPKVRIVILVRDGYECQVRLPGCTEIATEVDHIVPALKGGAPLDLSNLRASCKSCNLKLRHRKRTLPPSRQW